MTKTIKKTISAILIFVFSFAFVNVSTTAETAEQCYEYYEYIGETGEEKLITKYPTTKYAISSNEEVGYNIDGEIITRSTPAYIPDDIISTKKIDSAVQTVGLYDYIEGYENFNSRPTGIYRAVGYILVYLGLDEYGDELWADGTAFLEGPNILVTAGHLCYDSIDDEYEWGWAEDMYFYPGTYVNSSSNQITPYGSARRYSITVPTAWKDDGNNEYDWAVVTLSTPIGETVGYFGKQWSSSSYKGLSVAVTGYPLVNEAIQNDNSYYMLKSTGTVTKSTNRVITASYNTNERASGSPVYLDESGYRVLGIHSRASTSNSYATRITESLYNLLQEKLEEYNASKT